MKPYLVFNGSGIVQAFFMQTNEIIKENPKKKISEPMIFMEI